MKYLLLILGFVILTVAADWLVNGASGLAKRLNISNLIIGLTVVAFGTSAPELVVNLIAAYNGTSEIALTNILGSNTINTLIVLGISAVIYPIACKKSTFRYEIPLSIAAGLVVLLFGTNCFGLTNNIQNGYVGLTRLDGVIYMVIFIGFITYSIYQGKKHPDTTTTEEYHPMPIWKALMFTTVGLVGLVLGGELIVRNATDIARMWGVSEAVIGVTIVALGTSLPELATSAIAAYRHNTDLAIGNVIGSNIFNVFMVLGLSSAIRPLAIYDNFVVDASLAAGSSILLLGLIALNRHHKLTRLSGAIMLAVYALYLYWLLAAI